MSSRIFFAGNHFKAGGISNFNQKLIRVIGGRTKHLKRKKRLPLIVEYTIKTLKSDVIIFSDITNTSTVFIKIAKTLNKKTIFIMHGCKKEENRINGTHTEKEEKNEKRMTEMCDIILCHSKTHSETIKKHYPTASNKIRQIANGIDREEIPDVEIKQTPMRDNCIAVTGGDKNRKHNLEICRAVDKINEEDGTGYRVEIFGDFDPESETTKGIQATKSGKLYGRIKHDELFRVFKDSHLYIQNSEFESFGTNILEALACECNLLTSRYVGANSTIKALEEADVINDPTDVNELAEKIKIQMRGNNNERLRKSVNEKETSIEYLGEELLKLAGEYTRKQITQT